MEEVEKYSLLLESRLKVASLKLCLDKTQWNKTPNRRKSTTYKQINGSKRQTSQKHKVTAQNCKIWWARKLLPTASNSWTNSAIRSERWRRTPSPKTPNCGEDARTTIEFTNISCNKIHKRMACKCQKKKQRKLIYNQC